MKDNHTRSVAKAISWRIIGTIITAALVFIFTGQWALSIGIGVVEFIVKSLAYYVHERAWFLVNWGKQIPG